MPGRDEFAPKPDIPLGRYRHYKGGEYEVLTLACDETTHEWCVVYRALYETGAMPNVWIRTATNFTENVEVGTSVVPRFSKLDS